ncbi:antifungal protein ginkbilobin-like protein [Phoenix dactylifera]|uniref:Antifungal protein ginkbilobin-like protein n=1 Tax=Phoenix dactylifera TaxID=42345 RepID=A0A8B7C728_PHODC|nr:antifungal protein ginkbilobin-like protein [Phoenix dactylifera]
MPIPPKTAQSHYQANSAKEMSFLSKLPLTISALLILWSITVRSAPNTNITSVLCNSGTYTAGDPFTISLAYVLSDLLAVTPSRKDHDYYNVSPFPNAFAYGHAACKANLAGGDCSVCLRSAKGVMNTTCGMAIGARSSLVDCAIRYEQYPFVN